MTTAWVILIYGLLVAAGGVVGYARAQSVASLAAGGGAGLVLVGAAVAMMRPSSYALGWWAALAVALLLLARFGAAAAREFKWMPGGMIIALSLIALAALLLGRSRPPA